MDLYELQKRTFLSTWQVRRSSIWRGIRIRMLCDNLSISYSTLHMIKVKSCWLLPSPKGALCLPPLLQSFYTYGIHVCIVSGISEVLVYHDFGSLAHSHTWIESYTGKVRRTERRAIRNVGMSMKNSFQENWLLWPGSSRHWDLVPTKVQDRYSTELYVIAHEKAPPFNGFTEKREIIIIIYCQTLAITFWCNVDPRFTDKFQRSGGKYVAPLTNFQLADVFQELMSMAVEFGTVITATAITFRFCQTESRIRRSQSSVITSISEVDHLLRATVRCQDANIATGYCINQHETSGLTWLNHTLDRLFSCLMQSRGASR